MEFNLLLGLIIIVISLFVIIGLYWWSCRIIEEIHQKKLTSLREIKKELRKDG